MRQFEQLDLMLTDQDGMLQISQATAVGISKPVFYDYVKAEGVQVFTIKPELHGVGLTTAQTPFGHTVLTYDMERTICDLIRNRSRIEMQTFQGAIKAYAYRKDKNLRTLMQYAGMFRVEKILRQYLEILL